eukprot:TRINITY_DN9541_c0_g2_i2.p1 TRINITY_DN9541_c0_g2~~TRINITY_DN9541_c0_g2_i2.p1  ORF type:complete len:142 (+),score=13.29 TRINITY_DN9541_c0_g2_i2:50-475(+)
MHNTGTIYQEMDGQNMRKQIVWPFPLQVEHVLDELLQRIREDGRISNDVLRSLHALFPTTFAAAIQLMGGNSIRKWVCQTTRMSAYTVIGNQGKTYLCMRKYCSCPSFLHQLSSAKSICVSHAMSPLLFQKRKIGRKDREK